LLNEDLKYARWDGGAWQIESVDTTGNVGLWLSMALDGNGYAHISYCDYTGSNAKLKYARWNGGEWEIEVVDDNQSGWFTSIAVDNHDRPHISYRRQIYPEDLMYAHWNGSDWLIDVVHETQFSTGSWTSIAVDGMGNPHISYEFDWYGDIYHAWHVPPMALSADVYSISEATGGRVNFTLNAGASMADRNYLMLGTVSGTEPGILLPGGHATLPVNWDLFTNLVINMVNGPIFKDFLGTLDFNGTASAELTIPPVPGAAGITMHYAYALNKPYDFASNPVGIDIVP
jgi:hypothetical protein